MYDCRKTREFLGLYLDNELEAVPTQRVAEHLSTCASCRRELELLRAETELLAHSIKNLDYDSEKLRASIEAATVRRRSRSWQELAFPRLPRWAIATACAIILAIPMLLYIPGRIGIIGASPLYSAAAENHRTCVKEIERSDWARSQPAIERLQASFLAQLGHVPFHIGDDFELTQARVCDLEGEKFLHLVYLKRDGREVSLFVARNQGVLPTGDRSITFQARSVQLTKLSDLHVTSTRVGDCLLIATANEDNDATILLLGAVANIRA